MGQSDQITASEYSGRQREVVRKVWRRILWFAGLLLLCAQIDKHNIAFAALTMSHDLKLTATMFGLCTAIFYVGYVLCEIPSNLIMARVGARVWLARIAITIGLVSAATMFAIGSDSLLAIRFLLGVAEAGMIPGLLLYFTYWFPPAYRARANSWFLLAMPIAGVISSILSGTILDLDGLLGMAGWRWLFLLLGLPSVVLGIAAIFYLTDRPKEAKWLTFEDKQLLEALLRPETGEAPKARTADTSTRRRRGAGVFRRDVLLLAIANLGLFVTLSVMTTWTPQIVRNAFPGGHYAHLGWLAALPALAATIAMPLWSASSDARDERRWHVMLSCAVAAFGLCIVLFGGTSGITLLGLVVCAVGAYGGYGVFWTLVAHVLPERSRPAGIAIIHAFGTVGAALSPVVVGFLRDRTGLFSSGLVFAVAMLSLSVLAVCSVRPNIPTAAKAQFNLG
ncbi:MFS transporter [Caballeronia sp. INML2]|jgi:ACS family 4-hydroxyphenylacetate permease-like MFS transporter|uniref:MFS transporter n=1 Tax=Caballeronia sp. INML2 TaxID=2921748 RepID=UPI002027D942|nr:MFS transporter [Caballeronia sp. INML2]